ncbi:MAG: GNAT superfamily N-acetyltransferase [Halopseudomonas sp.]|uniref:GNAT family N-acetyltransferase n=1 Tax=Halopseudomonas sp. TaxID=2901191 RepID=UPI0039E52752
MILLDPRQGRSTIGPTECGLLDPTQRTLADQFYRRYGSRMKTRPAHQVWAIQSDSLLACLCLQPVAEGYWLTNLFVDPAHRRRGIAQQLIDTARIGVAGPVWLFCNPQLQALYVKSGFEICSQLPERLADRLERYQRSKPLIAMTTSD